MRMLLATGRLKNGGDIHELASTECLTKWGERQQRHTLAKELTKPKTHGENTGTKQTGCRHSQSFLEAVGVCIFRRQPGLVNTTMSNITAVSTGPRKPFPVATM